MRRFFKKGQTINWRYAFGEVTLIFIGITLALAFSNWNQNRQERKMEIKLLSELRDNLDATAKGIESSIQIERRRVVSREVIIEIINGRLPGMIACSNILMILFISRIIM